MLHRVSKLLDASKVFKGAEFCDRSFDLSVATHLLKKKRFVIQVSSLFPDLQPFVQDLSPKKM